MKKYILKSLFVSMLCMLAASCQDTNEFDQLDSSKAQVSFSIAMDSPLSRSRGADDNTWGGEYDNYVGDDYDNRIALDELVVKIEADGGKKYTLSNIIKWQAGAGNEYSFVGVIENLKSPDNLENARISVYANMGRNAEETTFAQNADCIPMWGMQFMESLTLTPAKRVTLPSISLLRAMAKIEVALNDEMKEDYTLTGATLDKVNPNGYPMPKSGIVNGTKTTTELGFEEGFNPLEGTKQSLPLIKDEKTGSWYVYLPEMKKENDPKITVQLNDGAETGTFSVKRYVKDQEPQAMDIVRNHWYKYIISGFDASEITVEYKTVEWKDKFIEVGGEGFLFLNKDLIEIYNANISEGELKFSSSSPIASIELVDLYDHQNNGEIVEGTADGVSAYYISKFGQKVQLGTDPGFDVSDKEADIARELVILSNISATAETTLNGGITIQSPFLADPTSEITELQQNSHYDTPRYLEFLVTNEQGLTATFRVMQYPPVVITNEEGFYSFRDDHVLTDNPLEKPFDLFTYDNDFHSVMTSSMYLVHRHDFTEEPRPTEEEWKREGDVMRLVRPEDFTGEPDSDYWATPQQNRDYSWTKKSDSSYTWMYNHDNSCAKQGSNGDQWYEIRYGFYDNTVTFTNVDNGVSGTKTFSGIHRPASGELPYSDYLYRGMYQNLHGEYDITASSYKGTGLSPYYKAEVLDKDGNKITRVFRDHYRWNAQPVFWSKFVYKYYEQAGQGASYSGKSVYKHKGQVDMYEYGPSEDGGKTWGRYIYSNNLYKFANNRMYKIKTTTSSDSYMIGYPSMDEEGKTLNTISNANLVSPSLMLASQLGETNHQQFLNNAAYYKYIIPDVKEMYRIATRHCREYVETTFKDENGNHMWNEGEEIIEYRNWRLPTKAEIEMIIDYQSNSRAMDKVLDAQYYYCVTGTADSEIETDDKGNVINIHNWVSSQIPGFDLETSKGYYIRCVRDVK